MPLATLVDAIDAVLPQTQCTRCGYPDCRSYAQAIAAQSVPINRCPPGGAEGIARLARVAGQAIVPLNPGHGQEAPRQLAVIDEASCIGCTLCLNACPVDCIVGGPRAMHTVVDELCTGCELCVPVCPVDCISLTIATGERTGWHAWSDEQAQTSRERYAFHRLRLARDEQERADRLTSKASPAPAQNDGSARPPTSSSAAAKQAAVQQALLRARERRG